MDVDARCESLPPSPPMTDSSTKSSPPSLLSVVSPGAETPPHSPNTYRSASPRHSPLPPLPSEVFLTILRYLPAADHLRLCLVSRAWYSFLTNEPHFWSSLALRLEEDEMPMVLRWCDRATRNGRNGSKTGGGFRTLTCTLGAFWDRRRQFFSPMAPIDVVRQRFAEALGLAEQASVVVDQRGAPVQQAPGAKLSTLETLILCLQPNSLDVAYVMFELGMMASRPLFESLQHFVLSARFPGLALRKRILTMFPKVKTLSIDVPTVSEHVHLVEGSRGWTWQHAPARSDPVESLDYLHSLRLCGVSVAADLYFPALPALTSLRLQDVRWQGKSLFLLLRLARRTLEVLECNDLVLEEVDDEMADWSEFVDVREPHLVDDHVFSDSTSDHDGSFDEPAPIVFPCLRTLHLSGMTPPLFASLEYYETSSGSEYLPTPVFVMPRLALVYLDELSVDHETIIDDSLAPLPVLGRNAPVVEHLVLTNCIMSDLSVFTCLAGMSARITHLNFFESTVSDLLLAKLPDLTPHLKFLDVRGCAEVTIQGVARLVEVIRSRSDEGRYHVDEVMVDPPQWSDHDWIAYRWLDFVGVLRRDDFDFEGLGPRDPGERQKWIRVGKRDVQWEYKLKLAEKERLEEEARRLQAEKLRAFMAARGTSSSGGGSSRGGGGGGVGGVYTADNGSAVFRIPPLSSTTPSATPSHPYANIAAPTPVPFDQQQQQQLQHHPQLQAQAPPRHLPVRTEESQLDLASLDNVEGLKDLDPALVREQQLALEQARQCNQRHRDAQVQQQAAANNDHRQQEEQQLQHHVYSTTRAAIAQALPAYPSISPTEQPHHPQQQQQIGLGVLQPGQIPNEADPRLAFLLGLRQQLGERPASSDSMQITPPREEDEQQKGVMTGLLAEVGDAAMGDGEEEEGYDEERGFADVDDSSGSSDDETVA
ncbi:hypothetical protein JCM1840_006452 [Sporobolomyces johnsonii]